MTELAVVGTMLWIVISTDLNIDAMATQKLLVRLPEDLIRRLRRRVSPRSRSAFVQALLEQALPADDDAADPLFLAALEMERDATLATEMAEWNVNAGDGIDAL